jgi:hypothetical protein
MRIASALFSFGLLLASSSALAQSSADPGLPRSFRGSRCIEVSSVVGRQHCTRYGAHWAIVSTTPVSFELAGEYHALAVEDTRVAGTVGGIGFDVHAASSPSLGVGAIRFRIGFEHYFYAGGEIFAGGSPAGELARTSEGLIVTDRGRRYFGGGAMIGVEVVLGIVGLRGEVAVALGCAMTEVGFEAGRQLLPSSNQFVANGLLEPRLAVDLWVLPTVTLGVTGGVDVVGTVSDVVVGVGVALHTRSYDDARL